MSDKQEVTLQMRIRADLFKALDKDLKEFDNENVNGSIALHFNAGVVQKIHSTVVS